MNTELPKEYMPILSVDRRHPGCPQQVPMDLLDEATAQQNHGQTLKRLKERGGLGVHEAIAIIRKQPYKGYMGLSMDEAIKLLNKLISPAESNTDLPKEVLQQIQWDAEKRYRGRPDNYYPSNFKLIEGYIDGRTEEYIRAQPLFTKLKYVKACLEHDMDKQEIIDFISKALQEYQGGKEGGTNG